MKVLDLFCGAGGSAMGLHRAWPDAEITGVDIKPQPHYPFTFVLGDAMTFPLEGYDFIWASPPCQAYSRGCKQGFHRDAPKLINKTRSRLLSANVPFVIENVLGAPLRGAVLCGASFGLGTNEFDLARHRIFETNFFFLTQPCGHARGKTIGVYGHGTPSWHLRKFGRCVTVAEMREAMGIDWMTRLELSQAIPPAYSEFIARQIFPNGVP